MSKNIVSGTVLASVQDAVTRTISSDEMVQSYVNFGLTLAKANEQVARLDSEVSFNLAIANLRLSFINAFTLIDIDVEALKTLVHGRVVMHVTRTEDDCVSLDLLSVDTIGLPSKVTTTIDTTKEKSSSGGPVYVLVTPLNGELQVFACASAAAAADILGIGPKVIGQVSSHLTFDKSLKSHYTGKVTCEYQRDMVLAPSVKMIQSHQFVDLLSSAAKSYLAAHVARTGKVIKVA